MSSSLTAQEKLLSLVRDDWFLLIGGASLIGQAAAHEIFKRRQKLLHVVGFRENNIVERVHDTRSTQGDIEGDFSIIFIPLLA